MDEAAVTEEQFTAAERVIVALDVSTEEEASDLIASLPRARFFKIGLEAITAGVAHRILALAKAQGAQVFWDGKFLDIKNTIAGASKALPEGVALFNLHAFAGHDTMRKAAGIARDRGMRTLAVTVLTDKTYSDLVDLGLAPWIKPADRDVTATYERTHMEALVRRLAMLAYAAGMDGVVCSPLELPILRREFLRREGGFLLVTPGIRPAGSATNDQKRVMTPCEAAKAGADYIVVGRPITDAKNGRTPAKNFDYIVAEFARGCRHAA